MSERKKFLLRLDEKVYAALEKWAADDLRSTNSQIEFLLKEALRETGRITKNDGKTGTLNNNKGESAQ